jgi:hypothetical protein
MFLAETHLSEQPEPGIRWPLECISGRKIAD